MEPMTRLERRIVQSRERAESSPGDLSALLELAQVCLLRDYRLEAMQALYRADELSPGPAVRVGLARLFSRQDLLQAAYAQLSELFKADPEHVEGHLLLRGLKEIGPVPPALRPRLKFTPTVADLEARSAALREEMELLEGEAQELGAQASGKDPEPVLQYHLAEARKRAQRARAEWEGVQAWLARLQGVPDTAPQESRRSPGLAAARGRRGGALPPPEGVSEGSPPEVASATQEPAPVPATPEPEPGEPASPAALSGWFESLQKLRGLVGAAVLDLEGARVLFQGGGLGPPEEWLAGLLAGLQGLSGASGPLQDWVLEGSGGIVILHRIDARHGVLVTGDKGAGFGALKYALEKSGAQLARQLAGSVG